MRVRSFSAPLLLALAAGPALAQSQVPPAAPPPDAALTPSEQREPLEGRRNQRVQRIVVEDAGSRVDELRVGGQTQSITVQPKTGTPMPPYEVRANDGARARPGNFNESDSVNAPRVWNLRKF